MSLQVRSLNHAVGEDPAPRFRTSMIAGENINMLAKIMSEVNATEADANKLDADMILVEAKLGVTSANSTLSAGLIKASGEAISGGTMVIGGAANMAGSIGALRGNIGQARAISDVENDVNIAGRNELELRDAGEVEMRDLRHPGADPKLSDADKELAKARIEAEWRNLTQTFPNLAKGIEAVTQGLGGLANAACTGASAAAQANAQMADTAAKTASGQKTAFNSAAQNAQGVFGQLGNSLGQTIQYMVALSQAH